MIFARAVPPLQKELQRVLGREIADLGRQAISPY
jgi:hypothetical protein